jgi:predicted  nucleic acid-binding Zn-ribbon protein
MANIERDWPLLTIEEARAAVQKAEQAFLGWRERARAAEAEARDLRERQRGAVEALREIATALDYSTQTGKAPTTDEWRALGIANDTLDTLGGQ